MRDPLQAPSYYQVLSCAPVQRDNMSLEIKLKGYVLPVQERLSRICMCSVFKYVMQFHSSERLTLADRLSFV